MRFYLEAMKNYAKFDGRATRQEYWMFYLINMLIFGALFILASGANSDAIAILMYLYYFAIIVPSLSVSARRMHDIGKSGWLILCIVIPFVGPILQLIWSCTESQPNDNQYGPDPHATLVPPSKEWQQL